MNKSYGLDEILGLLQAYPEAFEQRFKRKLKKSELVRAIQKHIEKKEALELENKFIDWDYQSLVALKSQLIESDFDSLENDLYHNALKPQEEPDQGLINNLADKFKSNFNQKAKLKQNV